MKRILIIFLSIISLNTYAGNPDRIGENGAYELLINGWPRSTGFWDMYAARVTGIEAMRLNPAGLAHLNKMEAAVAHSLWFHGSQTQVTQAGFAGNIGGNNVIGFELQSLNVGDLDRTTVGQPDPDNGLGTFKPRFINVGLTYSRMFSNRIYGGATVRLITENVGNVRALGFSIDLGLQYILGKKENLRFGVALRNWGTPMKYQGDGFTFRGEPQSGADYEGTRSEVPNKVDLPIQLNISASYDFWLGPEYVCNAAYNLHRLTLSAQFTSNSFGKDHFGGGVEYAFKEMFMARVGYRHEKGMYNPDTRTNAYTGFAGGVSVNVPFKQNGPSLGIDYSYRTSNPFGGTHSIGLRFGLGNGGDPCDVSGKDGKDAFKKKKKAVKLTKEETEQIEYIAKNILFETGSAELTDESKQNLDELAKLLKAKESATLNIDAYTDNVGDDDDNKYLSMERAYNVKKYLESKGIDSDRMNSKGHGEENPIDTNDTEEGRANNRRVELSLE